MSSPILKRLNGFSENNPYKKLKVNENSNVSSGKDFNKENIHFPNFEYETNPLENIFKFLDGQPKEQYAIHLEILKRYLTPSTTALIHQISKDPLLIERWLEFSQYPLLADQFHDSPVEIPLKIEFLKSDLSLFKSTSVELNTWINCLNDPEALKRALLCCNDKLCSLERFFDLYARFPLKINSLIDSVKAYPSYAHLFPIVLFTDEEEIDNFITLQPFLELPKIYPIFDAALRIAPATFNKCYHLIFTPHDERDALLHFLETSPHPRVYAFLDLIETLKKHEFVKDGITIFVRWSALKEDDLSLLLDSLKIIDEAHLPLAMTCLYERYEKHPSHFQKCLQYLREDSENIVLIALMSTDQSYNFCLMRLEWIFKFISDPQNPKKELITFLRCQCCQNIAHLTNILYVYFEYDKITFNRLFTKLSPSSPLIYWHLLEFTYLNGQDIYLAFKNLLPALITKGFNENFQLHSFLHYAENVPQKLLDQLNDLIYFNQYTLARTLCNSYVTREKVRPFIEKISYFAHNFKKFDESKFLLKHGSKCFQVFNAHLQDSDPSFIVDVVTMLKLEPSPDFVQKYLDKCKASIEKFGLVSDELKILSTYVIHAKSNEFEPLYEIATISSEMRNSIQGYACQALTKYKDANLALKILALPESIAKQIIPNHSLGTVAWFIAQRASENSNNTPSIPEEKDILKRCLENISHNKYYYNNSVDEFSTFYNEQLTFLSHLANDCVSLDAKINIPLLNVYLEVGRKLIEEKLLPQNMEEQITTFLQNPKLCFLLEDIEILDDQNHLVFVFVRAHLGKHRSEPIQKADVIKAILMTLFCYVRQNQEGNCTAISVLNHLLRHDQEKLIIFIKKLLSDGKIMIQKKNIDSLTYYPYFEPNAYCLDSPFKINKPTLEIVSKSGEHRLLEEFPAIKKLAAYLGISQDNVKEWLGFALNTTDLDEDSSLHQEELLESLLQASKDFTTYTENDQKKILYEGAQVYLSEFEPVGNNLLIGMLMLLARSNTFHLICSQIKKEILRMSDEIFQEYPSFKTKLQIAISQQINTNLTMVYHPTKESLKSNLNDGLGGTFLAKVDSLISYNLTPAKSASKFRKLIHEVSEAAIAGVLKNEEYAITYEHLIKKFMDELDEALFSSFVNADIIPWDIAAGGYTSHCHKYLNTIVQSDVSHKLTWFVQKAEDLVDHIGNYFQSYDPAVASSRNRALSTNTHAMNFHFDQPLASRIQVDGIDTIKKECMNTAIEFGNKTLLKKKKYEKWSSLIKTSLPEHLRKRWDQYIIPFDHLPNTSVRGCYESLISQFCKVQGTCNAANAHDILSQDLYRFAWKIGLEDYALKITDSNWINLESRDELNNFLSINPLNLTWELRLTSSQDNVRNAFGNRKYLQIYF